MDLLAKAFFRGRLAHNIPIPPRPKPAPGRKPVKKPDLTLLAPVALNPVVVELPGVAPWRDTIDKPPPIARARPSVKQIIAVCAIEFGYTPEQIRGGYRTRKVAFARHVAQYLASRLTQNNLPILGKVFYRDHTSILYAIRRIGRLIGTDPAVRELVERLEREIRNNV